MLTTRITALLFLATFLIIVEQIKCAPIDEGNEGSIVKRDVVEPSKPDVVIKVLKKREESNGEEETAEADETIDREKRRSNKKSKNRKNG